MFVLYYNLIFPYFLVFLQSVYSEQICNWSLSRFHYQRPAFTAPPRHESFNRFAPDHYVRTLWYSSLNCVTANLPSLCPKLIPVRQYHCMNIHTTVQSQPVRVEGSNEKTRMKGSEEKRKGGAEVNQESTDQVSRSQPLWIMEFHKDWKELMEQEIKPWSDYSSNTLPTFGVFQIQPELKASNITIDW